MQLSSIINILTEGLQIAAFVDPAIAPVAAVESKVAAIFASPEGQAAGHLIATEFSKLCANHGTSPQAVAAAVAKGRAVIAGNREDEMAQ